MLLDPKGVDTLLDYFRDNQEFQRMNKITYQYQKCVMTLPSESKGNEEGTTSWFLKLDKRLSWDDRFTFQPKMSNMLGCTRKTDFAVSVCKGSTHPVVFYIASILKKLALETFSPYHHQRTQAMDHREPFWHALHILHDPHPEYRAFTIKTYDLYEEYLIDSKLNTRTPTLDLSTLLAKLGASTPTVSIPVYSDEENTPSRVWVQVVHVLLHPGEEYQEARSYNGQKLVVNQQEVVSGVDKPWDVIQRCHEFRFPIDPSTHKEHQTLLPPPWSIYLFWSKSDRNRVRTELHFLPCPPLHISVRFVDVTAAVL